MNTKKVIHPYIGQIVRYTLDDTDARDVNQKRTYESSIIRRITEDKWPIGAQAHIGNSVQAGSICPMMITRVWSPTCVNGQVFLDGNDTLWALSVNKGSGSAGISELRAWF